MMLAAAVAACLAVGAGDDQIFVRDVAPAWAADAVLPLETAVGLAPAPGVERHFDFAELQRIAARFGLPAPVREVCVARPAAPPDAARLLDAMRAALPEARIEILDYSRYPVPEGVVEFPRSGLRPTGSDALWAGFVQYGGRHRAALWARVRVQVAATRVVAAADLPAGGLIDAASLRLETRDDFPLAEPGPQTIADVAGRAARRPIRAGEAIRSAWIERAKEVTRGDTVEVEVRSGAAVLRLPGQALASGTVGQTIPVLNPETKRRFSGRVEARGKVTVGSSSR
jgi:flagella basal body P-ring formation protein FlgA